MDAGAGVADEASPLLDTLSDSGEHEVSRWKARVRQRWAAVAESKRRQSKRLAAKEPP